MTPGDMSYPYINPDLKDKIAQAYKFVSTVPDAVIGKTLDLTGTPRQVPNPNIVTGQMWDTVKPQFPGGVPGAIKINTDTTNPTPKGTGTGSVATPAGPSGPSGAPILSDADKFNLSPASAPGTGPDISGNGSIFKGDNVPTVQEAVDKGHVFTNADLAALYPSNGNGNGVPGAAPIALPGGVTEIPPIEDERTKNNRLNAEGVAKQVNDYNRGQILGDLITNAKMAQSRADAGAYAPENTPLADQARADRKTAAAFTALAAGMTGQDQEDALKQDAVNSRNQLDWLKILSSRNPLDDALTMAKIGDINANADYTRTAKGGG